MADITEKNGDDVVKRGSKDDARSCPEDVCDVLELSGADREEFFSISPCLRGLLDIIYLTVREEGAVCVAYETNKELGLFHLFLREDSSRAFENGQNQI